MKALWVFAITRYWLKETKIWYLETLFNLKQCNASCWLDCTMLLSKGIIFYILSKGSFTILISHSKLIFCLFLLYFCIWGIDYAVLRIFKQFSQLLIILFETRSESFNKIQSLSQNILYIFFKHSLCLVQLRSNHKISYTFTPLQFIKKGLKR